MIRAPVFYGKVSKGRIVLDNRERFTSYLASFEGKRVELILREKRTTRSDDANRYYWAVPVAILADHLGNTPEEMHDILKKHFNVESTARMKTQEFWEYINKIVRWAAMQFSVNIPDPSQIEY